MTDAPTGAAPAKQAGAEVQRIPVFEPGQLVSLKAIVDTALELAIQSERNAEVLRRLATDLSHSLKRADALSQPVHHAAEKKRNHGRPTATARGPQLILDILSEHGGCASRSLVTREANFAESTIRTYIPVLREAGYITEEDGFLKLTQKRAPMSFTAR